MTFSNQSGGLKLWSRLRIRMAISYTVITVVLVLLLEGLVVTAGFLIITRSPVPGYFALARASQAAQIYALQAAVDAEGNTLDPHTTFENLHNIETARWAAQWQDGDPGMMSFWNLDIPEIEPGSPDPGPQPIALLIGADGRVLYSTFPDRFPEANIFSITSEQDAEMIRAALAGTSDGAVRENTDGMMTAAVAETVWNRDGDPIGAVFIQAPAGVPQNSNLFADVAAVLIPSGMAWLCMMLPVGLLFGFMTTRGIIRRIERLAVATDRFRAGDFSQRVPVRRRDEIGQLESQFNLMAEQLIDSFEQRSAMAEQSARREERARIEQEMNSAHYIQKALLPESAPVIEGCRIDTFYNPAREVGGDLYDFLTLPDGRLGIVIGDVTGKGIPAALIMATTTAMIRAAASGSKRPGEVLGLVNNLLQVQMPSGMFATCFYAILEPENQRLTYANAGHNIPYLARNGKVIELRATGMPLGLLPEQTYSEQEVVLEPEDFILFYTDGLVEAHNTNREMFGSPRLKWLLQNGGRRDGLISYLLNDLETFTGPDWEQEDDVTLIVVQHRGRGYYARP